MPLCKYLGLCHFKLDMGICYPALKGEWQGHFSLAYGTSSPYDA